MTSTATPSVAFESAEVTLHHGDCLDVLAGLPDCSVDSVVTDPPYGLANTDPAHVAETITRWVNGERDYLPGGSGFMGKSWDAFVPPVAVWDECLRVLKPGGHVLAFAGSRTVDLMTLGLRLAGFDIRDSIAWLYGSGFPKSMDVSKAIDREAGAERERVLVPTATGNSDYRQQAIGATVGGMRDVSAPVTAEAEQWQGWGTALKPAFEPVVVARKPLQGTVAANVLAWGTGALNIDGSRIAATDSQLAEKYASVQNAGSRANSVYGADARDRSGAEPHTAGRFPANVILDESQAAELDKQSGYLHGSGNKSDTGAGADKGYGASSYQVAYQGRANRDYGSEGGGASRFFKVVEQDDFWERERQDVREAVMGTPSWSVAGDALPVDESGARFMYTAKADSAERPVVDGIAHPTVKPLDLMRYLVRLVTPKGGTVLEPFAGSGTTLEAAVLEGFRAIGIEREADYIPLITKRLDKPHTVGLDLFGDVA